MPIELVLDSDVELITRVLASPVVLHGLVDEILNIDNFIVSFFFVELMAFPNIDLMLVMLMPWDADLCSDTEDEERVLLQILKVEDGRGVCPVGVRVELGLHLVLLVYLVSIVLHLVHHRSCFHEVYCPKVDHNVVPFSNVAVQL